MQSGRKAVNTMKASKFVKERNEAFFSLDRQRIEAYLKKRGIKIPENDIVFWAAIYKCIYNTKEAPGELKEQALTWLHAHGMIGEIVLPPYIFPGR